MKHLFSIILAVALTPAAFSQAPADQTVYTGVVEKIVNSYCIKCHTTEKKKGKLIMETLADMMKGGESQAKGKKTIEPGKSGESLMYTMTQLPADDDAHMPPDGKPQPAAIDNAIIKWWIDAGAKADTKLSEAQVPAELKAAVDAWAAKTVEKPAAGK